MASDIPSDAPIAVPQERVYELDIVDREINELLHSRQHYLNIKWINLEELDQEVIDELKNLITTLRECITSTDNQFHRAYMFASTYYHYTSKCNAPNLYLNLDDIVSSLSKQIINIFNNFIDSKQPIPSDFLEKELYSLCKLYDFKLADKVDPIIFRCRDAEYKPITHVIKYVDTKGEEFINVRDGKKRIKLMPAKLIRALIENNPLIQW